MFDGLHEFKPQPETGGSGSGSGNTDYNPGRATLVTVGGLQAGTTPTGSIQDTLDKMLFPFQEPAFNSFTIQGISDSDRTLELGNSVSGSNKTFLWATSHSANVAANSIIIRDVTNANNLATGLANDGSEAVTNFPTLHKTDRLQHFFKITGTNTQSNTFYRDLAFTWEVARIFGTIPASSLSDLLNVGFATGGYHDLDSISGITQSSDLSYSKYSNNPYNCTGGKYIFMLIDASLGTPTFTSGGFNAPFNLTNISGFTNRFGVVRNYNLFVSANAFNGASVPIVTS